MYNSRSTTDKNPKGLKFKTRESADAHTEHMNSIRNTYPEGWNVSYWNEPPGEWVTTEEKD